MEYLTYIALLGFLITTMIGAYLISKSPQRLEDSSTKIKVGALSLAGMLMLVMLTSVLYFVDESGRGEKIFDTTIKGITPLIGVVIGYLFHKEK